MNKSTFLAFSFICFTAILGVEASPIELQEGTWRGVINYNEIEVPFNFTTSKIADGSYQVTLINREERILIKNVRVVEDSIFIPLNIFHTEIRARIYEDRLEGIWKKYYRKGYAMPFKAEFGKNQRYMVEENAKTKDFSGEWVTWILDQEGKKTDKYWITLIQQNGASVNATVLTDVGDFRYMQGAVFGNEIFFSSFDGVHAFVFNGKMKKNKWSGLGVTDLGEYTQFICEPRGEIQLPDPFELVHVKPSTYKADFSFYDPSGAEISSADPYYRDKVLIVQIFGTWCANSMDATNFLKDFYQKNQSRGVEVVGIAYETSSNPAYGYSRIRNMQDITEVSYPIAYGGTWSKSDAAEPFPVVERLQAFPTLVVIDKQGYIRKVYSYFMGPATGHYYLEFQDRFGKLIDELLEEEL